MKDNFDFLKTVDKDLYKDIEQAQKLFRDEYFNQAMVQLRVYAEKMSKKVLNSSDNLTFDDTLNCLKDKIKSEREREFVEDLFFIKKEGNKCAHGEDTTPTNVLEGIKRAFEATINYVYAKNKDENVNKLVFDENILMTGAPMKENKLVDEYVKRATQAREELEKQPKNPKKEKIKKQIKEAKKNLKIINNDEKQQNQKNLTKALKNAKNLKVKKGEKGKKSFAHKEDNRLLKFIIFIIFVTISLFFLTKMLFFL